MNISPVISPSILQTGLFTTASAQPVAYSINPPATTSASVVDISWPGKLLSVASIFGDGVSQSAATSQGSFATVVATTQLFVDVFNSFLQSGSDNLQNPAGGSFDSLFMQVLNSQATATSGDGKSIVTQLAEAGIDYQAPSILNKTGQMTVDLTALQSAFNADPIGTSSLLAQAIQSIGPLATAALNGVLPTTTTTLYTAAPTATTTTATLPLFTATASLTATEQLATTAQPTATALISATESLSAAELLTTAEQLTTAAQPTTVPELPTTTTEPTVATPLAATTTVVATAPQITSLPTTATVSITAVAAAPTVEAVVTTATPSTFVNPLFVATDPATAAAIAAYHLVDGILDTGMPHVDGHSTAANTYKIWAVANIRPIKLDLHV